MGTGSAHGSGSGGLEEGIRGTRTDPAWRIAPFVAVLTALAGLGVQAGLNVWLWRCRSPLVTHHRPTLAFLSAVMGDGLLLPGVNAALVRQLQSWRVSFSPLTALRGVLAGAALTAVAHLAQGALGLVNWSMPRRFAWNWIGGYHALFMWAECAFLSYSGLVLIGRWRAGRREASWPLASAMAGILSFAALVAFDYRRAAR